MHYFEPVSHVCHQQHPQPRPHLQRQPVCLHVVYHGGQGQLRFCIQVVMGTFQARLGHQNIIFVPFQNMDKVVNEP